MGRGVANCWRRLCWETEEIRPEAAFAHQAHRGNVFQFPAPHRLRPDQTCSLSSGALLPLPGLLQAKLTLASAFSPFEAEADHLADEVMGSLRPRTSITAAMPVVSRKCVACDHNSEKRIRPNCQNDAEELRTKSAGDHPPSREAAALVRHALDSPQQPLDRVTQTFFQSRTGFDFTAVSIHTNAAAWAAAQAIGARAFTAGREIVFGRVRGRSARRGRARHGSQPASRPRKPLCRRLSPVTRGPRGRRRSRCVRALCRHGCSRRSSRSCGLAASE
jgi:Domain of unknown function (DUF4157)